MSSPQIPECQECSEKIRTYWNYRDMYIESQNFSAPHKSDKGIVDDYVAAVPHLQKCSSETAQLYRTTALSKHQLEQMYNVQLE